MAFLVEVSTLQGAWLLSMLRHGDIEMTGPAEWEEILMKSMRVCL